MYFSLHTFPPAQLSAGSHATNDGHPTPAAMRPTCSGDEHWASFMVSYRHQPGRDLTVSVYRSYPVQFAPWTSPGAEPHGAQYSPYTPMLSFGHSSVSSDRPSSTS